MTLNSVHPTSHYKSQGHAPSRMQHTLLTVSLKGNELGLV